MNGNNNTTGWMWLLSPTLKLAEIRKGRLLADGGPTALTSGIKRYNVFYFAIAVALLLASSLYRRDWFLDADRKWVNYIILLSFGWFVIISRAVEIFVAFLNDAVAKLNGDKPRSDLNPGDRLRLAFRSYFELLFNFATLYYIMPSCWFKDNHVFNNIFDAVYFSGITMTTVGYGDISPSLWPAQMSVLLQIFCGLTLAVLSFTVYTSIALANLSKKD